MSRILRRTRARVPDHRRVSPYVFEEGTPCGPFLLSPTLSPEQRGALEPWIARMPERIGRQLPRVKIAPAGAMRTPAGDEAHAGAFIRHRYMLLAQPLFARRRELGRILFHEVGHFLWPRLGPARHIFADALRAELESGVEGELGHSAALAKSAAVSGVSSRARWSHYVCESFCDTGAFVLLVRAGEARRPHSEWTLERRARAARAAAWLAAAGLEK